MDKPGKRRANEERTVYCVVKRVWGKQKSQKKKRKSVKYEKQK